jgi:branched-chain amino acid transport system ATP-binding protein
VRAAGVLRLCRPARPPAADLPHVDRRLVEIARALATQPQALLLDEPAAGLSREDKDRLAALLRRIAAAGIGVLLVEHDMPLVMAVSDQVVVLDAGQRSPPARRPTCRPIRRCSRPTWAKRSTSRRPVRAPRLARRRTAGRRPPGGRLRRRARAARHRPAGARGELVALLGANGAGKSTLMRALAGLHRPVPAASTSGTNSPALPAERIARLGLVLVPEGRQVFPELSVRDNLRLGAFHAPARAATRASRTCCAASRACASGCSSAPACCRAASSRCWRWPAA